MGYLGHQITGDLYGCNPEVLRDCGRIEVSMNKAAELAKCTPVASVFHEFNPFGVSGVVVVQESHLAIHTWPEHGYAAVDIFTCGEIEPQEAFEFLTSFFEASSISITELKRGSLWPRHPS